MTKPDLMAELDEALHLWHDRGIAYEFLRKRRAELEAAVRDVARYAPCLWVPDDDTDSWDTACGNKHQFIAGDPADNLYQHCPYCGGRLIEPNYDAPMRNSAREVG
jgi:hypothetical protein